MHGQSHFSRDRNEGFTLVEILIVIVILGVLATVTVLAMRGTTSQAEEKSCANEAKTLYTSIEAYFVDHSGRTIPESGVGDDRYEQTLVDAEILNSVSSNYDIDEDGELTPAPAGNCT
jgi:general secretion pathway protein G